MADLLPDSRARRPTHAVQTADGWLIPIYCANCGGQWGLVPERFITFAFALCNDCYGKHGAPAHTMMEPDAVFWARVDEAMREQRLETLALHDLLTHAGDPSSKIGKLLRERYATLLKTL